MRSSFVRRIVAAGFVLAIGLSSAGGTMAAANPTDSSPQVITNLPLHETAIPQDPELPEYQGDAEAYGVQLLEAVSVTVAPAIERSGLVVIPLPLKYGVLQPGTTLQCGSTHTLDGTLASGSGLPIAWCHSLLAFVVMPTAVEELMAQSPHMSASELVVRVAGLLLNHGVTEIDASLLDPGAVGEQPITSCEFRITPEYASAIPAPQCGVRIEE